MFKLLLMHGVSISFCVVVAQAALNFKDITDALAFYGVYHREPMNQIIHFFGVPAIIWSALIFLAHVPLSSNNNAIKISTPGAPKHRITYATLTTLGYIVFYLKIDPYPGGILYTPFIYLYYITAVRMVLKGQREGINIVQNKKRDDYTDSHRKKYSSTGRVLKIAAIVHVLAWYVQIHPGHKIIEGAAPAITQSFGGALTSAPLFAFYEGLWLMGINLPLKEQTKVLVAQYTKELCENGVSMRACIGH